MDSPDRNHINAASQAFQIEAESPAFQNSPVFNYLSNLSPIKPVRNVHVGRGFLELNFPPPPNVFTSPRIGSRRELCSLKRTQYPDSSGAEKLALCYDDKCKALAAAPDGSRQSITKAAIGPEIQSREMIPCAGKECDDKGVQSQASSPSRYVDQYLADPVEESPGAVDSNDPCSNQATELPRALQGDSSSHTEVIAILVDVKKETKTEMDAAPTSSEQLASIECVPAKAKLIGENSLVHVKPVNIEEAVGRAGVTKEKNGDRPTNEWPDLLSENINDQVGANPSPQTASGTQQDNHLVDQETVAFSSLMSEGEQDEVGDWKEGKPFCSSGLLNHGTQDVKLRLGEMGQQDEWDCTPQLLPESFENVQADDNPNEKSRVTSCETPECEMPFGCGEHSLYQRGMPRRCLHFEAAEARRKSMGSQCSSLIPANIVPEAGPPATCHHFETLNSTHIELNTNLSSKQVVNFSQQASSRLSICSYKTPEPHSDKVARSFHNNGNSPVTVPKPSGIGLHLNSIGNAVAMNCTTNMQLAERDYLSVHGEKSFSGGYQDFSEGSRSCSVSVGVVVNVSVKSTPNSASPLAVSVVESTEIDQQDSQCSGMGNSSASFCTFPLNVKPVASALPLNLSEKHLRPCEKKRMVSHDASGFGISPKKRRRKPPDSIDNEGCKRCNCKKSKCLKLYCECFAAGVYCVEPCSCQECFNKPEYEDTVLSTRQQIESRNPLAFAPRIVRRVTESPSNSVEDSNQTPASARHKRGCNCKKSMCLKKYCECYQAGVGCSDGCRCEGCKNIFGKKNGCREIIRMECREADDEEWEDLSEEKLDIVEIRSDILHPEQCHSGNLSPITPLFQCSSRGREIIPKSHLLQRRHLQSPDSEISNALSSCGRPPRSPRNSNTNSKRFSKGKEGSAGLVPFDKRQNCDKAERVDQFSPKWDGFADICSLTPLSNSPSRPAAASGTNDCNKILRSQLCHGSGTVSSSGSVHWRSSPVTPMPHFGGTKFVPEPDSNSGVHSLDDDTPEILKDNCSPIKPVKVSSPNQKRVSPPHNCLQELRRSSSSLGLRSGRKFILQSVPSFPPLTPYSEAKGSQK